MGLRVSRKVEVLCGERQAFALPAPLEAAPDIENAHHVGQARAVW
jgi:hypothetical protein